MSKPKVLIVGCGAVGLSQGYQLSSGANITYLVRPGRKPAFVGPKHLYSYKDNDLYAFDDYRVIESVSEISGETFAFVFDTLDGHTARSEGGVATIASVGDFLNEKQNVDAFLAYDAVGLDIEDHYVRTLRIAPNRLFLAASMIAHQPSPLISIPPTANKDLVAKADLLFCYMPGNVGLIAVNTKPALTKRLEAIYNVNGKVKVATLPAFVAPWALLLSMLHLVTWNIDKFGPWEHLRANKELWGLMLRAQSEILNLPRFGWVGWVLSFVIRSWATEKMNVPVIEGVKPLKFEEFNAFHHGAKVAKQDLDVLEDVLAEGEKTGKKMDALKELVRRARALHA